MFSDACSSNSIQKDIEITAEFDRRFEDYCSHYSVNNSVYETDVVMVEQFIIDLKKGKASGVDELVAEHLKNAHPILCVVLSKLFNMFIVSKYVPPDFGRDWSYLSRKTIIVVIVTKLKISEGSQLVRLYPKYLKTV